MRSDNLVPLLVPPPLPGMGFRQGTVVSFNLDTGANVIDVGGTQLVDVPCLNVTDAAGLLPGMVVGLLTWKSSWWIIGRVAVPGTAGFADLTIRAENGSRITFKGSEIELFRGILEGENAGRILARQAGEGRTDIAIGAPYLHGDGSENAFVIEGWTDTSNGNAFVFTKGQAIVAADAGVFLVANDGSSVTIEADAGDVSVDASDVFRADAGTNMFITAAQQIQLISGDNQVFIDHLTTTNPINCRITEFGQIMRDSSARRFKLDIEDLVVDAAAVLTLRPRTWRDKTEVGDDPDTTHRIPGFVAEEVAEIPGMDVFVTYDQHGEVESIAYDRLSAALVTVIQQQQTQIDALTERLDRLEAH